MIRGTEEDDTVAAWVDRFVRAMEAIQDHAAGRRGVSAVITCPCCGTPLWFLISAVNGHVHARCETVGCVDFIQ